MSVLNIVLFCAAGFLLGVELQVVVQARHALAAEHHVMVGPAAVRSVAAERHGHGAGGDTESDGRCGKEQSGGESGFHCVSFSIG